MTTMQLAPFGFLGLFGVVMLSQSGRSGETERGTIAHFWTLPLEVIASVAVVGLSVRDVLTGGAPAWPFLAAGSAVLLTGWWLYRRAQEQLGRYWSLHIELRPNQPLVDRGVYRWCRHPAYLGLMIEVVALPVALASPAGLAAALFGFVPVVLLRTWLEERALEQSLGDVYRAYEEATLLLVPGGIGAAIKQRLGEKRARTTELPESAEERAARPRTDSPLARAQAVRVLFALAGVAVALCGLLFVESDHWPAYLIVFFLLAASHFACVDLPPPVTVIPLPHLTINAAFAYIIGLPVVTLDYVAKQVTFRIMVFLHRRGISRPPAYLFTLVDHASRGERVPREPYIDHWANHAAGAIGCAVRWGAFTTFTLRLGMSPILAVLFSEAAAVAALGLSNLLLPLPAREWLTGSRERLLQPVLQARADVLFATLLFLPAQVFLIYYGFQAHGLIGATVWSLAAFGPHHVLKVLNQRRTSLVQQNEELVEKSAALQEANRALAEKARALGDKQEELRMFVYAVTHDLKDPLGAMMLMADQVLEEEGRALSAEGRQLVGRIAGLSRETERMIGDLLEVFRVSSAVEEARSVDVRALVEKALGVLGPQIAAKGLKVEVGWLPRVWGQAGKLGHAVTNLVSNAVKYAPAGGGVVEVGGEVRDGGAVVWVRDNGRGIAPAYHRWIFELFGRVPEEERGEEAGSGVGLAIVKRAVEGHGGAVWVESRPGAGTSFYVRLPLGPQGAGQRSDREHAGVLRADR